MKNDIKNPIVEKQSNIDFSTCGFGTSPSNNCNSGNSDVWLQSQGSELQSG